VVKRLNSKVGKKCRVGLVVELSRLPLANVKSEWVFFVCRLNLSD
jgi:hypothetical protein